MNELQVEKIYIHKNIIKKIKRDPYLKEQLIHFYHHFNDWLLEGASFLEQLEDGVYANKLLYHKLIVFDRPIDLESVVFWDFLTNDHSFKTKDTIDDQFQQRDVLDIIEGNQFIFFSTSESFFEQKLEELCQSIQLELQFVLDSEQEAVLNTFYYEKKNVAITGAAGAGKTLMLNRIAHTALENGQSFLYVTFSDTLKERFYHFLKADMDKRETNSVITTYEGLIRKFIAPQVNIDADHYMRFIDCQIFLENSWEKLQKDSKINTLLSKKDVCRILMTLPTNNVGDFDDTKGKSLPSTIQAKLKKLKSTDSWAFNDEDCDFIMVATSQYSQYVRKQRKKHWSTLLHDIDSKLESDKMYINYQYILIDEMQDLGQFEFTFLLKLMGRSGESKLIATFDANQRISFEGSTDRNFANRLSPFEKKIYLPHSYRNAANIYKLAERFKSSHEESLNTHKLAKTNINLNKVKFLLSKDTDELINQATSRFIPEENLNIGILAFGQTYEKYYKHFLHEDGRKKFIGIEYYNEEQIKGLEFTNLIIIDFLELYRVSQSVSQIEMRKWYVAITRACDNLLIHIQNEDDLLAFNKINLSLFEEEYSKSFFDVDEAIKRFNEDILVSLGDEQKTLLAQEAQQLLYMYREKKEYDYLEDAVDLFYKVDMLESLRNLLELIISEQNADQKMIAYELVKVCIELNDQTLIKKYMPLVDINHYHKIEEKVNKVNPSLLPVIQELFGEKPKSQKIILKEVRQKTTVLKNNGDMDQYILVCSKNEMFGDIIYFFKTNPNLRLTKESYKRIGRAFQKEGKVNEAITFYINHQMYKEAMLFYEGNGNYQEAFTKCIEVLQKDYSFEIEEKAYQLAMKMYEENYFKQLLEYKNHIPSSTTIRVLYEMFKMTKKQDYLQQGIELAYQQKEYIAIIRFYEKENSIKNNKRYQTYLIESYESLQRYEELANLFNDLEDYASAYTAFHQAYELKPNQRVTEELILMTTDFIQENFAFDVTLLLQKHFQQMIRISETNKPSLAVHLLIKLEKLEEAVKTSIKFELFDEVIKIAQEYPTISSNCSIDVAKAYEQVQSFEESADVHKEANRFASAATMLLKANKPLNELLKPLLIPVVEQVRRQPTLFNEKVNEFILRTFTADFEFLNIQEEFRIKKGRGWLNTWLEKLISAAQTQEEAFYYQYLSQNKIHIQQVLKALFLSKSYEELIQYYALQEEAITTFDELAMVIQSYEKLADASKAHYDVHFKWVTTISKIVLQDKEMNTSCLDALNQSVHYLISSEYFAEFGQLKQLFKILKLIETFLPQEMIEVLIEIALINQISLIEKKRLAYHFLEFIDRLINDVEFKGLVKFLNKEAIEPKNKKYSELYQFLQFTIHIHLYQASFTQFAEYRKKQMELAGHEKGLKEFNLHEMKMKDYYSAFKLIVESIENTMKKNNEEELLELEIEVEEGRKSKVTYQYELDIINKKEKFLNQINQYLQEGKDLSPLLNRAKRERKGVTLNPVKVKKQREKLSNSYQEAKRQFEREKEVFNLKINRINDFVRMYPGFLMPNMEKSSSKLSYPITYMFLRDELVVKTQTDFSRLPFIFSLHYIEHLMLCKNNAKIVKMLENILPINNTLAVEQIEMEKSPEYLSNNTWEIIEEIVPLLEQQRMEYQQSRRNLQYKKNNNGTIGQTGKTTIKPANEVEREPISDVESDPIVQTSKPEVIEHEGSNLIVEDKRTIKEEKVKQSEPQEMIKIAAVVETEEKNHLVDETKEHVVILRETNLKSLEIPEVDGQISEEKFKVSNGQHYEPNVDLMFKLLNKDVQAIAEICGLDEKFVAFCTATENEPAYATRQLIETCNYQLIPMLAKATGISEHVLFQYKEYMENKLISK